LILFDQDRGIFKDNSSRNIELPGPELFDLIAEEKAIHTKDLGASFCGRRFDQDLFEGQLIEMVGPDLADMNRRLEEVSDYLLRKPSEIFGSAMRFRRKLKRRAAVTAKSASPRSIALKKERMRTDPGG
jgi:hypothetical protein